MPDKMLALIISYVPLLMGEAGRTDLDPAEVGALVDQADGTAKACIWLNKDDAGPSPCLLFEGARAIADHLKMWAEDEPEQWFKLVLAEHGGLYGLALMPNLDKGVERFRMAYQLRTGYPLPPADFQMIFKPLNFVSLPGHVFSKIRKDLQSKACVCLMESSDFKGPDTDWEKLAIDLGTFEVVTEGPLIQFVLENLKQSEKDGNK